MSSQHGYVSDLLTRPPPTAMSYNRLGKSGLKVSKIILGAMSFGSKAWQEWVLEEDEALPLLHYAYSVGINTWDTVSFPLPPTPNRQLHHSRIVNAPDTQSDLYSNGLSERLLGKAIAAYRIPRESLVLLTKCRFATSRPHEPQLPVFAATQNDGRLVNRAGLSRKHILDAARASVARLGGTYIDVFQIQRMDPDVPREEIMRALNDVVEMGLARYIGASSVSSLGC